MTESHIDHSNSQTLKTGKHILPFSYGRQLLRKIKIGWKIEFFLAVLAIISAVATYIAMSRNAAPLEATSGNTVQVLLRINGILLIGLGAILARWFVRLWAARRADAPGSRLQTRVTGIFIALAIVPPIVMTIFSAMFFEFGVQTWFSDKVRTTINSSLGVAEAYMLEHRTAIEKDLASIALAYSRLTPIEQQDSANLQRVAESALSIRLLSELLIIEERDGEGSVLARVDQNLSLQTSRIKTDLIEQARQGRSVVAFSEQDNTVVGIIRLRNFFRPTFLYVARDVNPEVINYLQATRAAVDDYEDLEGKRSDLQLQFNVVFIIIALLILLTAIWLGLRFSSRLVKPISHLIEASERVGQGDLHVRVPRSDLDDDLNILSRAFNRMTSQLFSQQEELLTANNTLEERRRFLEKVLEGVSAGVLGLNEEGTVFLSNRAACAHLGLGAQDLSNKSLKEIFPSFSELMNAAVTSPDGYAQGQVRIDVGGEDRTLLVAVAATKKQNLLVDGFVVTFDDLTDQLAHQRTAAWADVARRVAHEIKNPLTPIQLSAERLKRKYQNEIETDPAVFTRCTDTIIRQVGDLRRMVDEFSSFARMPAPIFRVVDVVDVLRQAVFLQEVGNPMIKFKTQLPGEARYIECDGRLIGQALTNVLKNAAESIEAKLKGQSGGLIFVEMIEREKFLKIHIKDNGRGLPKEQKDRLMEPYVTTRQKGTGLGLAIVRKIMEEHGGSIRLADATDGDGACVELVLNFETLKKRAMTSQAAVQ